MPPPGKTMGGKPGEGSISTRSGATYAQSQAHLFASPVTHVHRLTFSQNLDLVVGFSSFATKSLIQFAGYPHKLGLYSAQ